MKTESIPYQIPLFDLDIGEEEIHAVQKVLESKWLTMGDVTRQFEEAFAAFLGVPYCFAVCNGTAALHLALKALGIGPGDEVICPALTFVATANAIIYSGARPVFADITGQDNLNISPAAIETKINEHTKAIMVVHYAGYPCDMQAILGTASKYNLRVIEDAAHAPGAKYCWTDPQKNSEKAQFVGGIGDIGCFSFFSNKNLATGEGGMLATNDEALAHKIKIMRSHGMTTLTFDRFRGHSFSYDVIDLGYNYRIDEIRSAIGQRQLQKLQTGNERRKTLDNLYREMLQEVGGLDIPFKDCPHHAAHHIFPVLLSAGIDRVSFMKALQKKGIQTSIHYLPVHQFSYYQKKFDQSADDLKWTEYAGKHEVTLPLYPSLKEEQVEYIADAIKKILP